ncbi:MAG: 2Fe-2S iron-sulfur cluster binding domain-containing protein [Steroidobacteraceae bacterium]
MQYHAVHIEETGETYRCSEKETLLDGMARLGKKGIPVGCRGGGCGVCKVQVTSGQVRKRVMSREHVSVEDEAEGRVLACRVYPESDVKLAVLGKMKKNVLAPQAALGPAAAASG